MFKLVGWQADRGYMEAVGLCNCCQNVLKLQKYLLAEKQRNMFYIWRPGEKVRNCDKFVVSLKNIWVNGNGFRVWMTVKKRIFIVNITWQRIILLLIFCLTQNYVRNCSNIRVTVGCGLVFTAFSNFFHFRKR